jgi:hypothetical protein
MDTVAKVYGWNVSEKDGKRYYTKENLIIMFRKEKIGFKIAIFKRGKIHDSDITKDKDMAMALLAEDLILM